MKSASLIFPIIAIIFLSLSCQNANPDNSIKPIGVANENDCLLERVEFHYSSFELAFEFIYSNDNKVIETNKFIDGELEQKVEYYYSADEISGLKRYFNDTLTEKCKMNYSGDSVELVVHILNTDEWVKSNVLHLHFNTDKEIVKVGDLEKKEDGSWGFYGTGYIHEWNTGKLSMTQNWIFKVDTLGDNIKADDFMQRNASMINDRAFMFSNKYFYDNNEIELFYESSFEYDDKNNPFRVLSLASLVFPSDFNTSVNNPTNITKTYSSGEKLMTVATYEYNENNFPTSGIFQVKFESDTEDSIDGKYKVEYFYRSK